MGFLEKTKEIGQRFLSGVCQIGKKTIEVVESGAILLEWNSIADKCRGGIKKIEEIQKKWKDRLDIEKAKEVIGDPYNPGPPRNDVDLVLANTCTNALKKVLNGNSLTKTIEGLSPSERLQLIDEVRKIASEALDVEVSSVQYFRDNESSFGFYNREYNTIFLNEAFITSENDFYFKEAIFTIFHETMHALQWKVVKDYANGIYHTGFSREQILELAANYHNYIDPSVDFEAYRNQPTEAPAFFLVWYMKQFID